MIWTIDWRISVDGVDMSSQMNGFLLSLEVTDADGQSSDTASLEFSDTEAQMFFPGDGALVAIFLEGILVFEGTVDDVRSSGSRGEGRKISVSAQGFDSRGKVKQPLSFHSDAATLDGFLNEAARLSGLQGVVIDEAFRSLHRDYWSASGETILHLGQRLARELGGTFKIRGNKAVLAKRGSGQSPGTGGTLPVVRAVWGQNLRSWQIAPFLGRKRFTRTRVRWFDRKQAKWRDEDVDVQGKSGSPDAVDIVRFPRSDALEARGAAGGRKADSEREGGEGSVTIDLDPLACAEGSCLVQGTRPGVDGLYRISSVSHRVSRGGAQTSLELKQPQGSAGTDPRKPAP